MSKMIGGATLFWLTCGNALAQLTLQVSPNPALMDDRLRIIVTGAPPNRSLTLRAVTKDQRGCAWHSSAVFLAAPDGSIDLSAQAPSSGTYGGVDAMGLFWSMAPDRSASPPPAFFAISDWFAPVVTELDAVSGDRALAGARVVRRFAAPGVRAERWNDGGISGILYRPADDRAHPGVLLLGGSEGGFPTPEGAMLASRGFITLALAYFGAEGLPRSMQKLPVEYFGRAIHALQSAPGIRGARITILGASRGGEAALLAGSFYTEVNGVIGVSASHVRWEGATARELPGGRAWTYQDKPLPYVAFHIGPGFAARYVWAALGRNPISLKPMFLDSLSRARSDDAQIAVEKIRGPILLASGSDDRKWPSARMSGLAMERLRRRQHPYPDQQVVYEGAGHWLPSAYLPASGLRGKMADEIGGSPAATARVQAQWWPRLLGFLAAIESRPQ